MKGPALHALALLALLAPHAAAQKQNESYQLHIHRAPSPVVIDGSAHEPAWESADVVNNFWMVLPMDTGKANVRTDVRMMYDDKNIYLSAICFHGNVPGPFMVESLRRDWGFGNNDNFIFFLDTFDDQTNGFTFGVNAAGAQWDGLLYEGGKANLSWDNKWTSAVKTYDDRYEIEIAIPFRSIRYKKGITRWGVNFSRLDLKTTEKSSWTPIPRHFPTAALALTGVLIWDEPPPSQGPNISLIPYALGGISTDHQANTPREIRHDIGLDAKIAIGSALNLDLTANPDFSQVDVDQQVTNLDRYELFFPEKRQFFLENGDQFANFGYATIRPFFSRRIGLGGVPIRFGARLSGKLNKDWRLGIMDMQTGAEDGQGLPPQNFSVFALQRRLFSRSNIGILLVDKESASYQSATRPPAPSTYNRNAGLEYNLASADNLWTGKLLYLRSFQSGNQKSGSVYAGHLQYNSRRWLLLGQSENIDPHYTAEVGYVPRNGYRRGLTSIGYTFLPEGGRILSHGPILNSSNFFDWQGKLSDYETTLGYTVTTRGLNVFTATAGTDYVRLLQPFDPTNSGREKLETGTVHRWNFWTTKFDSKPQSVLRYGFSTLYGGYYANGTRLNLTSTIGYRIQPYVSLTGSVSYNDIRLKEPWGHNTFWLIGPRFDVTLTNTLYFTTFVQYNEQQKNMNVNTRIQWRYKPASDVFLVWTDNYMPEYLQPGQNAPGLFAVKNRALVLKWTYWWNL
ncbi:carbohydrate binding family 9 domain-containing protein [Paludibaculum fermentans]|uniref:Carbohydrate binding family 9 domain-containing protein n=1 Tax=Paludibaculum fermentans TaxID=1473598 RepID=A0A7S7NTD5_PALFE|nr:carbohydrate binding family 9 domain-containing protein [Paludibaculum fermentans]QOY89400.1 carbohydrate binding family 9 domain-containing protein [Paludibaculum fermentans]